MLEEIGKGLEVGRRIAALTPSDGHVVSERIRLPAAQLRVLRQIEIGVERFAQLSALARGQSSKLNFARQFLVQLFHNYQNPATRYSELPGRLLSASSGRRNRQNCRSRTARQTTTSLALGLLCPNSALQVLNT